MPSGQSKRTVAELIVSNKAAICASWIENIRTQAGQRTLDLIAADTLAAETTALLDAISIAFSAENYTDIETPEFTESIRLLTALSASRAELGFTPSETATSVLSLKDALLKTLQSEFGDEPETLHREIIVMNKVIDQLALITFEEFTRYRETLITEQHLALEHSTPVITLWEGLLLMPLMGIVDTRRAQKLIETLLDAIVSTESRVAIIDLTAVPAFDTRVAQHIIKTVSAAKMLGAEVIITGISPDAAQTLTKLGIDLGLLDTRGGLVSGMVAAYKRLGKEVREIGQ